MAYRKLGVDNKHRRSMLATLTKQVILNGQITTTETRAKEVRKAVDKMITYGKKGDLGSRRRALAFLHNDKAVVNKILGNSNLSSLQLYLKHIDKNLRKEIKEKHPREHEIN